MRLLHLVGGISVPDEGAGAIWGAADGWCWEGGWDAPG